MHCEEFHKKRGFPLSIKYIHSNLFYNYSLVQFVFFLLNIDSIGSCSCNTRLLSWCCAVCSLRISSNVFQPNKNTNAISFYGTLFMDPHLRSNFRAIFNWWQLTSVQDRMGVVCSWWSKQDCCNVHHSPTWSYQSETSSNVCSLCDYCRFFDWAEPKKRISLNSGAEECSWTTNSIPRVFRYYVQNLSVRRVQIHFILLFDFCLSTIWNSKRANESILFFSIRYEGVRGYYKGMVPAMWRLALNSAFFFSIFEEIKQLMLHTTIFVSKAIKWFIITRI